MNILENCKNCANYQGSRFGGNLFVCGMYPHGNQDCPDFKQSDFPLFKLIDVNNEFNDFVVPIQDGNCVKIIKHPNDKSIKLICFKLLGLENSELLNLIRYKCDRSVLRLKHNIFKGFEIRLEHLTKNCFNLDELGLGDVNVTVGVRINDVIPLFLEINQQSQNWEANLFYLHVLNEMELSHGDRCQHLLSIIKNEILNFP